MLTLAQIAAILQLLLAFNVPTPTVNTVEAILMAPHATTTIVTPVIITPSKEEVPIIPIFQFGGVVESQPVVEVAPEPIVPQPVTPQKPTLIGTPKLTFSSGEEKILMALDFTVSEEVICKWGPNYYSTPRQPEVAGSVCSVSQGAIRDLLPKESCNQNGVYAPWEGGLFKFKSGQTYTCNLHLTAYPDTQRVNTEADFTFTVE